MKLKFENKNTVFLGAERALTKTITKYISKNMTFHKFFAHNFFALRLYVSLYDPTKITCLFKPNQYV